jgi:hypothetical protein
MDDPKELKKQQEDYERKFSKKKKDNEKLKGKGEAKKPRCTAYPEIHYACSCPYMRTYHGDIDSSTCKDCKVRGNINIVDDTPDCTRCMCQCQAGVFMMKDIDKLAAKCGIMVESKARTTKQSSFDTQIRESLETIIKSSIHDGIASLQKLSSEVDDGNVISIVLGGGEGAWFWGPTFD